MKYKMPDVETQTEDFIILSKEQIKKLSIPERKLYKQEYKSYKHEKAIEKHRDFMRIYMRTYSKMKYKYDPAFREKQIEKVKAYQSKKKELKKIEKIKQLENNNDNPETKQNIYNLLGLLTI